MKFKKILAGVLASAIALTAGIVPVVPVAAETNSEEMSYGDFKYKKVDEDDDGAYDYVEITDQNTTGTILKESLNKSDYKKTIVKICITNQTFTAF